MVHKSEFNTNQLVPNVLILRLLTSAQSSKWNSFRSRDSRGPCANRFLAWEGTSVKRWESVRPVGSVLDLLQGIIFGGVDSAQNLCPTVEFSNIYI